MSKQKLFDDESEEEVDLKTENEYAKKYDKWRGKEEIHKLEQKYGTNVLNSDPSISSDSEDESDDPSEVSEETETQFLKTLALLKTKDPRIYDPGFKFFDEKEKESVKEAKEKTLTFADSDEDDDADDGNIFSIEKKADLDNEQKSVAKQTETTVSNIGKDGKLKDYLTGKLEHIDDSAVKDLEPLKALWSDPKLNEGEAFLRDYILNKKYLSEGPAGAAGDRLRDDDELGADELTVEEQDKFERAYNFRFEEPDHEYLKRFPRTMSYIRPKDERRSKKRAAVRSRKDQEKTSKMEEIGRLKALKLQEIQEKIARIKEVTGNQELAFKDEDIEGDFDPAEHDKRMRAIFDEQYYGEADHEKPVFPDLDKELEIENWDEYEPEQEEKEAQDFSVDAQHCEDAEFNMDADYDPSTARASLLAEMRRSLGAKRRNRKNKSKLAKLLAADKPKYIPAADDASYAQHMEEYYKMDCEDVIGGDLPTRFKYREVVPNDYGLTVEEILLADDKELTQWVPLKKIVRHKPDSVQKGEVNTYALKAADRTLKRKVLPSLFKNLPEEPELVVSVEENSKKKKKNRKKNKQKATGEAKQTNEQNINNTDEIEPTVNEDEEQNSETEDISASEMDKVSKKKEKRKKHNVSKIAVESSPIKNADSSLEVAVSENLEVNNVETVGDDNVKIKNHKEVKKQKNKNKVMVVENGDSSNVDTTVNEIVEVSAQNGLSKRQKKNLRRKIKKKGIIVENVKNTTPSRNSQNTSAGAKKRKVSENEQQVPNKKTKNNELIQDIKKKTPFNKEGNNNKEKPKNKDLKKNNKDKFKNKNIKNNEQFKNKIKQVIDKNKQNNDKSSENPMSNLSDERLKAYGLNPKKYRGFLKYKKF